MNEVKELNAETGEEIIRPATPEEIREVQLGTEQTQAEEQARQAALNKLLALGLELSDLEALGIM